MTEFGEDYWTELGTRAVACPGWRWMPGMLARIGRGSLRVHFGGGGLLHSGGRVWSNDGVWPDLRDPATVGCLLALVREAWRDPGLACACASYSHAHGYMFRVLEGHHHGMTFYSLRQAKHDTEAEALVAALEGATTKEAR